jgi:hypothetical protein
MSTSFVRPTDIKAIITFMSLLGNSDPLVMNGRRRDKRCRLALTILNGQSLLLCFLSAS